MDQSMMEALGYGYTLVTTTYLTSLVKDLKSNDTLMPTEFPSPLPPTPASLALRNTHYRRPVQTFYSASEFLSVGSPASSSVFTGFRFLMLDPAIASIYEGIIQSFKGTVEVVKNASEVKTSGDKHTVVLLSESDFNTVSDIVLCNMADAHKASDIVQSYISLYKKQYCLIPEENVHLALYRDDPKEIYEKTNACYLQSSETVVEEKEAPKPSPEKKSNLPERKSTEVRKHERAEPAEAPTPEPVNAAPKETSAVEPRRSSSHEVKVTPAAAKEDSGKAEPPKSRLPAKSRLAPRIPAGQEPLETPNNLNDYYNNLDEKSPSVSDDEVEAPRGSRDHVDEKRPVVVHAAEQVKSSPRQRVDAVKVSSEARSNRRASVSKEPEIQHHVDPEKQGSQKRAKRQIIRRESVSVRGSASVTRRASASVSYQRQDSLRSKETPLRTTTPRVSNSVPRNRPGTGGHPAAPTSTRNRSPKARPFSPNKDDEKPHTSARRRRSSSTSASPSTSMTNPGQIPGLRANSLSTAEGAAADAALGQKCVEFTRSFLDNFMTDVEKKTRMIVRQTFVDSSSQRFLEEGIQDLHQFLQQMTQTEQEIPPLYSSEETRRNCYDVRQKATYILRKIKGTYDSVKTKPPPSLLKARDALSARPTSPKKNNRYASLSSESARRSGGNKESSSEAK
ncbi:recombination initiation protein NBS1 [Angomonas deanei]|nr:recombination initiation protein NBS1 [Angomonas deanei]|eukprot:EPY21299.1 recombination initiation protein NBS1 [Angomonas deanei]